MVGALHAKTDVLVLPGLPSHSILSLGSVMLLVWASADTNADFFTVS
jgi:hypothetical protein